MQIDEKHWKETNIVGTNFAAVRTLSYINLNVAAFLPKTTARRPHKANARGVHYNALQC